MFSKTDVLQGTIELLVLKRLSRALMHGYGIASRIETATDDVLRVEEGSLYPALYRIDEPHRRRVGRVHPDVATTRPDVAERHTRPPRAPGVRYRRI